MVVTTSARLVLAVVACVGLGACAGTTEGNDCVSHYDPVATAASWESLKREMRQYQEQGRVASVRTQDQGKDVGAGDEDAVRVVDLLDRRGRRLLQVDVWRTDDGAWRAGAWMQCTD